MTNEERELMRGLLTEDGMIDFDHPLFEEEEHILDGSEEYVVKSALNNALLDVLLPLLTLEEIVKNIKYLSYKQLEDPLRDLLINDFTQDLSISVVEELASVIVAEESVSESPSKLIRWIHTHRQVLHDDFLTVVVNKVATLYSDLIVHSDKTMKPTESNFLSFFSKCIYNDTYDEVEEIMNKVILEAMGEDRIRFDIENVPGFRLYSNLIKNIESASKDVSYYNIDHITEAEILKSYLILHDQLREEMGLSVQKDDSEEILETTVKISDIIKKFK